MRVAFLSVGNFDIRYKTIYNMTIVDIDLHFTIHSYSLKFIINLNFTSFAQVNGVYDLETRVALISLIKTFTVLLLGELNTNEGINLW